MRRILVLSITIAILATACGGSGGALSAASWCEVAKKIDDTSNAMDNPTPEVIHDFADQVESVRGSAPAEIKDDVDLMAEFLQIMAKAVDDNDGNVLLAFDSITTELNDPKYEAAGDRISAYNERECGIVDANSGDSSGDTGFGDTGSSDTGSSDTDGGSTDTVVPTEGIIAGLAESIGITEDQARCLVSKIDFTSDETPQMGEMMSSFADCGIDPLSLGAGG